MSGNSSSISPLIWLCFIDNTQSNISYKFKKNFPKISVITPSYNQGEFIEETIKSVIGQNYQNLEYIIIDGMSSDNSLEIIKKYEKFISKIIIEKDKGQSDALQKGFTIATGDILCWINSDDIFLPNTLHRVAEFFVKNKKVDFICSDVILIGKFGNYINTAYSIPPNWWITSNIGLHGWPQQGCFWRKKIYDEVGGIDIDLQFCMDRDLFIKLNKFGNGCRMPGKPTAAFRIHSSGKSATLTHIQQEEDKILIDKYGSGFFKRKKMVYLLWYIWIGPIWIKKINQKIRNILKKHLLY